VTLGELAGCPNFIILAETLAVNARETVPGLEVFPERDLECPAKPDRKGAAGRKTRL
jgi:hypothetical protein